MSARSLTRDEDRWAAVIRRDPYADGAFYYAVRTTGVYCRPSCAARPARRENVSFHESCEAAERAGFRPCKRCRPNKDARADADARHPSESIRFLVNRCSLGRVLVAATGKGVCAVLLGNDAKALERDLQRRFPAVKLLMADEQLREWAARVVELIEAPQLDRALPLDVRGTEFQRRIWQALREIPSGVTASYQEIAKRVGAPEAVRAVAQACAANAVAVVIPCHRVVRSDGSLSGYRWGVDRKRALLAREAGA